jgi:hypothetical protein
MAVGFLATTYRRPFFKNNNGAAAQCSNWFSWAEIAKNGPKIGQQYVLCRKLYFLGKNLGFEFRTICPNKLAPPKVEQLK